MTAQEQQMLQGLTDRINQTQLPEKDAEAEQMLQQTLGHNPDALYILAQTVLVQQYALEQAQKQLADARAQLEQLRQQASPPPAQQPKHATSFLGNLLGLKENEPARPASPAPPPAPVTPPQYAPVQGYQPVPGYAPVPAFGAPVAGYGMPGGYAASPQGGFLRSAMQTATGVAAGALAFEGIESLMHGFGHAAGYGSGFEPGFGSVGGFGEAGRPEEIVNNYYGDTAPHSEHSEHTDFLSPSSSDRGSDRGIDDRGTDSSRFSDAVYRDDRGGGDNSALDSSTNDDAGTDDSSGDYSNNLDTVSADLPDDSGDGSSYDDSSAGVDDGGGFDSGGTDDSGGGNGGF
jgi:uncharacterized protein